MKKLPFQSFNRINSQLFFKEVDSLKELEDLRTEIEKLNQSGTTVVINVDGQQRLFLAPGHDPYQVRKDLTAEFETKMSQGQPQKSTPTPTKANSKSQAGQPTTSSKNQVAEETPQRPITTEINLD